MNKTASVCLVAALIAAAVAGAGWYQASTELRRLRIGELNPITALLKEDQALLQSPQTNSGLRRIPVFWQRIFLRSAPTALPNTRR